MSKETLTNILITLMLIGLGTVIKGIYKLTKYLIGKITLKTETSRDNEKRVIEFPTNTKLTEEQIYYNSHYYQEKRYFYSDLVNDIGNYGEYLIYDYLKDQTATGAKFLFNTYLNKDKDHTTEIDVMLINQYGIFVFESKNYSGWIFGNEKDNHWTQTLPQYNGKSHKEYFYNPVRQNETHINTLKEIYKDIPIYSIIVFSERCELKNVTVTKPNTHIIKRNRVKETVEQITQQQSIALTQEKIEEIYNKLYPFTKVTEEQKQKHIEDIKKMTL